MKRWVMPLAIARIVVILAFILDLSRPMQLYYFLAILLSLCSGSLPESSRSLPHSIAFSVMLIGTWWCICLMAARIVARAIQREEIPFEMGFELFDRQMGYLRWLSLGLIVLCLGGFGLASNIQQIGWIEASLTLQSLLLLLPAGLLMVGLWVAEFAFGARVGVGESGVASLFRYLASVFRASVAWILAPLVVLMLVFDLASIVQLPTWFPAWICWALLGVAFVCSAPLLVRFGLKTKPVPEEMRRWLASLLSASGEKRFGVMIWDTHGRSHNAMIAGLLGRFRMLVLSDRLVADLPRPELAMVILHELAHVKRQHIPLRILGLLPAWFVGFAFERWASAQNHSVTLDAWGALLGSGISIGLTVVLMRWISHRIEHDADDYATKLAQRLSPLCEDVPATREEAAQTLASALLRVTHHNVEARRSTWLHPGIDHRLEELGVGQPPAALATAN